METTTIVIILFIPTFVLLGISLYHLKNLVVKITGKTKDIKGTKDFMNKSYISNDILLEILIPKKYSEEYPDDYKKIRIFAIPALLLFIPTFALNFYIIFKPYFISKEYGMPIMFFGVFILFVVVDFIFIGRKHKSKE